MIVQGLKQRILTTPFGRWLSTARGILELTHAAIRNREAVGTHANDEISTSLVVRLPKPGSVFVDVGAHIGSITAAVLAHCPDVRVIAIEATPDKAKRLRLRFPRATVHDCAVGEQDGTASFHLDRRRSGYNSLRRPSKSGTDVTEIQVGVKRLDDLVGNEAVDVVKIDVEGAELGVLRGAPELLRNRRPLVMFESGPTSSEVLGFTKNGLWEEFERHDYAIQVPNRVAHEDDGLGLDGFLESHIYPRRTTNYFAVPRERRTEFRDRARAILGIKTN